MEIIWCTWFVELDHVELLRLTEFAFPFSREGCILEKDTFPFSVVSKAIHKANQMNNNIFTNNGSEHVPRELQMFKTCDIKPVKHIIVAFVSYQSTTRKEDKKESRG